VIVWRRWTTAAVVDPVGWKANWSLKVRLGGGLRSDGYIYIFPDDNVFENSGNNRRN